MKHTYFLIGLAAILMAGCQGTAVKVDSLKVEMQENPEGVGTSTPRFSWQIASNVQDIHQKAYRIQVARSEQDLKKETNLLWDSGDVPNDESVLIPYEGEALLSREVYYWRVKAITNQGETAWSKTGHWSMALLNASEWQAKWIGEDTLSNPGETGRGDTRLAARYLRKPFESAKRVKRAVLYISGLGAYEAYINGQRVSDDILAPTVSWYPERVYYNVHDVTRLMWKNDNLLAVKLGNGRYFGMRESDTQVFGLPRLLAQLEIEYTDGTREMVVSDESWEVTSKGPVVANNEFDGEEYDARKELPLWNLIRDDTAWKQADIMAAPGGTLTAQPNPNIRIQEELTPVSITGLPGGKFILDMGQNMVGWIAINRLKAKKEQPITLRFAETLNPDGTLYMANLRGAKVTDIYTPAKDGPFSWEPSFVFHGFRFVEIEGLDYQPELSNFTGKVIYDQMETTGQFETSDETINQLVKNAYWGIRGNYRGMPTDCPQRDERMGWLGDRATGSHGESFIFNNHNLYAKWLKDIEESQTEAGSVPDVAPAYWRNYNDNMTWPGAYLIIANMLYEQYGDDRPVRKHYESMKKWMSYMRDNFMEDNIMPRDLYGDWCMPPESPEMIHSADPARKTEGPLLGTSFYYHMLRLLETFATLQDKTEDATDFSNQAALVREAYNARFFDEETARYSNNTVTANLLSLRFGLVPEGFEERVFENIVDKTMNEFDGHVSTGLVGIQWLMRGLTNYGRGDIAYTIATNRDYPSWGYMIENGATTIWELWNGDTADPTMNSHNHVMLLGDLIVWFYEYLAGIQSREGSIGFREIHMQPYVADGLDYVTASHHSVQGLIKSAWTKEGNTFEWDITIPGNSTALVYIPANERKQITESGDNISKARGVKYVRQENEFFVYEVGSGDYRFKVMD